MERRHIAKTVMGISGRFLFLCLAYYTVVVSVSICLWFPFWFSQHYGGNEAVASFWYLLKQIVGFLKSVISGGGLFSLLMNQEPWVLALSLPMFFFPQVLVFVNKQLTTKAKCWWSVAFVSSFILAYPIASAIYMCKYMTRSRISTRIVSGVIALALTVGSGFGSKGTTTSLLLGFVVLVCMLVLLILMLRDAIAPPGEPATAKSSNDDAKGDESPAPSAMITEKSAVLDDVDAGIRIDITRKKKEQEPRG